MTAVDGFDGPSHGERAESRLGHPAWAPVARLAITETEHVIATTRRNHFCQAVDVALAVIVIEDVEEPAVEHRVELLAQINETECIRHQEARLDAPLGRLGLCQVDGLRREVDPHRFVAE